MKARPYGTWSSPVAASQVARAAVRLLDTAGAAEHQSALWLEARPSEGGRGVIVRRDATGVTRDVTPAGFDVRSRVHEYGGGAFIVHDDDVYFSHDGDGRVYRQPLDGGAPVALTPAPPSPRALRYADFAVDARRGRLLAVAEDHTEGGREPVNRIVAIALDGGADPQVLVSGADFYAAPRASPDGDRLCFIAWDHPELPFLATRLYEAALDAGGGVSDTILVAGAEAASSDRDARAVVAQPSYAPDGTLTYLSDRSGYANLHQWRDGRDVALAPVAADLAHPAWTFGHRDYLFLDARRLLVVRAEQGQWGLWRLELQPDDDGGRPDAARYARVDVPYTAVAHLARSGEHGVIAVAGGPQRAAEVVRLDLGDGSVETLRSSTGAAEGAGDAAPPGTGPHDASVSVPEPLSFPTTDGATAHAFFYPPRSATFTGPDGALPPLIVKVHGGPTGACAAVLDPRIQFWTSRGFAVVDVNYRGSTGFGRAYRDALEHRWGIVDVDDCVAAARHLVEAGRVDGDQLLITGGSAGGYTTLAALAFRDAFRAGASHYGVSDLEALMADTHKFESHYDVYLLGPDESGRASRDVMRARSPLHAAGDISCPVIFIQGLEDRVVPPNQAEMMVAALRDNGVPVAYVAFEGEQHGFRKAENIARALEAELYFYRSILGLTHPEDDEVASVLIEGIDSD
ncbi:MAG: S9 family peptidase [Myxococcota bacterium]